MQKMTALALAALLAFSGSGCWGPEKLTRRMDDWTNQTYVENPWMMGNTVSACLLHGIFLLTNLFDVPINAYYFWGGDAWPLGSGTGTKFEHRPVTPPVK